MVREDHLVFILFLFLGDLEKAVVHFTNAILNNPSSALLYAKRARYVYSLSHLVISTLPPLMLPPRSLSLSLFIQYICEAQETQCCH